MEVRDQLDLTKYREVPMPAAMQMSLPPSLAGAKLYMPVEKEENTRTNELTQQ